MAYVAFRNWRGCRIQCDRTHCLFDDSENLIFGISSNTQTAALSLRAGAISDS
jgi:hypothetical protein